MNISFKTTILTIGFALLSILSFSQSKSKKVETTTFWVASACSMCEETIEKAMDTKGVLTADYSLETSQLTVTYKPKKISLNKIHQILNENGYDTEQSICTEEQYNRVDPCCRYRELEKH